MNAAVVKRTQEALGKVIRRPPLTEKLLNKPPFRYLHDIITEVSAGPGSEQRCGPGPRARTGCGLGCGLGCRSGGRGPCGVSGCGPGTGMRIGGRCWGGNRRAGAGGFGPKLASGSDLASPSTALARGSRPQPDG